MSIRVTLNCPLDQSKTDKLTGFLEENLYKVRSFSGNLRVSVFIDEQNQEMLLDEDWKSVENHKDYLSHIRANGVLDQLATFLTAPPTIKYFSVLEI